MGVEMNSVCWAGADEGGVEEKTSSVHPAMELDGPDLGGRDLNCMGSW